MFEYMSTQEAAEQWGISERRIQKLCEQKRIEGVVRFGHLWTIPTDAIKPVDERRKKTNFFRRCNISRTFDCYTICKKQRK